MDNYYKPEEFYELIRKKKEEIKSLNLSESEKNKLYKSVDETVQRFKNIRSYALPEKIVVLNESFNILGKGLAKLVDLSSELLQNTIKSEKAVFKFRIRKAFDSQNPLEN